MSILLVLGPKYGSEEKDGMYQRTNVLPPRIPISFPHHRGRDFQIDSGFYDVFSKRRVEGVGVQDFPVGPLSFDGLPVHRLPRGCKKVLSFPH